MDGISADAVERVKTPVLDEIANYSGYTRAYVGGQIGAYNESPTVSAVGYNHLLTGTWSNKHNVYDNAVKNPRYAYWSIFRLAQEHHLTTGIFSTWTDNRIKLLGEGLPETNYLKINFVVDGMELDETKFPHTNDKKHFQAIDEHVSAEAARHIRDDAPDLSWVYLQYTDDAGHLYGDSDAYDDAVQKADRQLGKIWEAIKMREQLFNEKWMIVITTDHGRDALTGKDHGGQSERERTTWICTNLKNLNARFTKTPAIVDIMPTLTRHLGITIPESLEHELDGVPFVGKVSVANLKATLRNNKLNLQWDVLDESGNIEIYLAQTNSFSEGGKDEYRFTATEKTSKGYYILDASQLPPGFYKVLVKAPFNAVNVWIVK